MKGISIRGSGPIESSGSGESGAALVLVMWFTLIISLIAAAVASTGQSNARIAVNLAQSAKAQALAEGGLQMALAALSLRETDDPWLIDGSPRQVRLEEALLVIEIRDEAEKPNLDSADLEELENIFLAIERTPFEARAMAEAIIVKRGISRIEATMAGGGQRQTLRSAPFFVLGDIQGVTGISDAEYKVLRNLLSVYSPATRRLRQAAGRITQPAPRQPVSVQPRSRSRLYAITVHVEMTSGAMAEVHTIVRLAANRQGSYQILHWE